VKKTGVLSTDGHGREDEPSGLRPMASFVSSLEKTVVREDWPGGATATTASESH